MKTDGQGHILGIVLTAGQCHESTQFETVMASGPLAIASMPVPQVDVVSVEVPELPEDEPMFLNFETEAPSSLDPMLPSIEPVPPGDISRNSRASTKRPKAVACDKAYSALRIRNWCHEQEIEDVIPTKSNETPREGFDKDKYVRRNIIERAIGWLKECRRVLSRFEKYALHYLAFVLLAIIQRFMTVDL